MDIQDFAIKGPKLIIPKRFRDARGFFQETWSDRLYREIIGDVAFVQDNLSVSIRRGTLRGLHFQQPPLLKANWCESDADRSTMSL